MRKSEKKGGMLLLLAIFLLLPAAAWSQEKGQPTRMITDRAGREVQIPETAKKIACLHGPSYEKLFMLGAADRVALTGNAVLPWNYKVNPKLKDIPVAENTTEVDVERLLQLKADLILYHPFAKQIEKLEASGLPVVVPYDGSKKQTTLDGFLKDCNEQILFYGDLLGGNSREISQKYCTYVNERIKKITDITSKIPAADRPRVFYVCGQIKAGSNTQSKYATAYWLVDAAGGTMQTLEDKAYFLTVSTEQIIAWNPDIILVATLPSTEPIVTDPRFQKVSAVKTNRVIMNPEGLFYWTHFSSEYFLNVLFLAKLFHPDLFPDLDVKQEVKDFYAEFYHYLLTDDEADRILKHLPPGATTN